MSPQKRAVSNPLPELLWSIVSVACCAWLHNRVAGTHLYSTAERRPLEIGAQAIACWFGIMLASNGRRTLRNSIECSFSALGAMLLAQSGLLYFFHLRPLPWIVPSAAAIMAVTLSFALARREELRQRERILLFGWDSNNRALARILSDRVIGILEDDPARVAPSVPYLGKLNRLRQVVDENQPAYVVVGDSGRLRTNARELVNIRYAGCAIEPASSFFERHLSRINSDAVNPFDLLFSSAFTASPAVMAVQAVYTNVIALGLLLLLSPLLLLSATLIRLTSGEPALARTECPGFQNIPFTLLRFRARGRHGERIWIGELISRLGLANLPQLINVVRGEMTLVGPPPVRVEFAQRLAALLPTYEHRFAVRPGILGWSQAKIRNRQPADEKLRLEYDLYYVKEGSISMDVEIFLQIILGIWSAQPEVAA